MKNAIIAAISLVLVIAVAAAGYYLLTDKGNENSFSLSDNVPSGSEESVSRSEAPDFKAFDESGNEITLSSQHGKPVVLNFWASWCGPCREELPGFQTAYENYGERVGFMMVNLTDGGRETMKSALAFLGTTDYTFPVYFDRESSGAYAYSVSSIPMTVIVDKNGGIVKVLYGSITYEKLSGYIEQALQTE